MLVVVPVEEKPTTVSNPLQKAPIMPPMSCWTGAWGGIRALSGRKTFNLHTWMPGAMKNLPQFLANRSNSELTPVSKISILFPNLVSSNSDIQLLGRIICLLSKGFLDVRLDRRLAQGNHGGSIQGMPFPVPQLAQTTTTNALQREPRQAGEKPDTKTGWKSPT